MNPTKKSWRTTTCGILAIVGSLIPAAIALLDGDPSTVVNYQEIGIAIMGLFGGGGLIAARDAKVSSEDQGIK
jgi:hypothetical protein